MHKLAVLLKADKIEPQSIRDIEKGEQMKKASKILIAVLIIAAVIGGGFFYYSGSLKEKSHPQQSEQKAISLQEAISLNNLDAVKFLLKNGADIEQRFNKEAVLPSENLNQEEKGYTALGWALFVNRPQIAEYLISQGADVTASVPMSDSMLYWAIAYEHEKLALLLIEKGADIYPTKGYNPALHAKVLGMNQVVSKLAEKGIKISEEDSHL